MVRFRMLRLKEALEAGVMRKRPGGIIHAKMEPGETERTGCKGSSYLAGKIRSELILRILFWPPGIPPGVFLSPAHLFINFGRICPEI